MKIFYRILILASGVLLSFNSYSQMSGTYTVNGTTGMGNFVNLTGPVASAGTIKILVASPTIVTGAGTAFTASWVGAKLYTSSAGLVSTFIGTIASWQSATQVTLSAPYSAGLPALTVFCGPDAPGAFAAINANGSAGVTLNIAANLTGTHTEPGTTALTNQGSVSIINGGGSIIEGANVAANANGMIRLSGCSSITIGQSGSNLIFRNDNTTSGADLVFLNGSSSNLVQYSTFENENTSVLSTALGGAISFATDAAGAGCNCGNSSNTIDHCTIRDRTDLGASPPLAHNGIVSKGTATALNNSNTISNCKFDNIEGNGVWVDNTGNGDSWNITTNDFYWDKTTAVGSLAQAGIFFNAGVANANNVSITNNYIGGNAVSGSITGYWPNSLAAGSFTGIYVLVGPSGSASITGNTIAYINLTGATSATISGIQAAGGIFSITGNNIGDVLGTNTIESSSPIQTIAGILLSATTAAAPNSTADVETNNINAITSTGTGACNVYGISNTGTGFINNVTISNNSINTLKCAGTTGILAGINNTANVLLDFETNTITKLTYSGTSTGTTAGIYMAAGQGSGSVGSQEAPLIYNNTINTITNSGSGAVACITAGIYNKATNIDIYANIINTLKNTNASSATTSILAGIDNAVVTSLSMDNNTINTINLSGLGTTAGIYSVVGTNPQIYSNTINDLHNLLTVTAGVNNIAGIYTTTTGTGNTDIEYNNVYNVTNVNTSSTGVTAGINNAGGAATTLTISNNTIDTIKFSGSGSLAGIYNAGTSTVSIASNTINSLTNIGTGTLAGIYFIAGSTPSITSNTISGISNTNSTAVANIVAGIYNTGTTTTNADIESNVIYSVSNTNTSGTGLCAGVSTTSAGANVKLIGNQVYSFTYSGTSTLIGISTAPGVTGTKINIQSNQVYSLTRTGAGGGATSQLIGIAAAAGTTTNTDSIIGNTVYSLINSSSLVGVGNLSTVCAIYDYTTATSGQYVYNNTIYDLENTYVGANVINITGIAISGPTTSVSPSYNVCARNNIYLDGNCINGTTLTAANIIGVDIQNAAYDVVNNTIMLGDPTYSNTNPYTFSGIKKGAFNVVDHIYFNSVIIVGKVSSGAVNTYCYNANAGTSTADLIKNNIFSNKRTNSGTAAGSNYAMYFLAANVFDYNDYYTNGTGGLLSNGNNSVPLSAGQDAHSLNVDPLLQYCSSSVPCLGTLYTLNHCQLGGAGITLSANTPPYTVDGFNATTRVNPPDIGANEFSAPYTTSSVSVTPSAATINKCTPIAVTLNANAYCSPVTYAWSPSAGLSATNIANPVANPTVTTNYTVVATSSSSATSSATVIVTVGPYVLIGNASVCLGSTSAQLIYDNSYLIGNPNQYSITWDATALGAGLTNLTNATFNLTTSTSFGNPCIYFTVPGTLTSGNVYNGTFSVKNSSSGCSSGGYAFTLTVVSGPPPNANLTFIQSPSPAHQGDNVTLTVTNDGGSSPPGFSWIWWPIDLGQGYGTTTNSLSNISLLNNIQYDGTSIRGPGNVWWIISEENACGGIDDQGALKYSQVVPLTTHVNPTTCGGTDGSITFTGLSVGQAYDITYSKNGTAQTPITSSVADASGNVKIPNLGAGTYSSLLIKSEYYLAVASAAADNVTLTVPCGPTAYAVTGGGCSPATVGVANSQTGDTYQLKLNGSNVGSTIGGTNGSAISFGSQSASGTYTVVGSDGGGNTTLMTGSVTVNPLPSNASGLSNQIVCGNGNVTFTVTDPGSGFTVEWSTNGTSNNDGTGLGGSGNLTITKAVTVGTPITEYARISNNSTSCKSAFVSATGTANAIPSTASGLSNQSKCGSGNVTFTVTDPGAGFTVEWSTNGSSNNDGTGTGGSGNLTNTKAVTVGSPITEYARISNNGTNCKSAFVSATGTANAIPSTPVGLTNQTICGVGNVTFTATDPGSGFTVEWSTDGSTNNDGTGTGGAGNLTKIKAVTVGTPITEYARLSNNSTGCKSAFASAIGTANAIPSTPASFTNQTACTGTGSITMTFTVTDPGVNFNVEWSTDGISVNDGILGGGAGDLLKNKLVTVGTPVTEYARLSNNTTSCKSAWISATATANASPSSPTGLSNQNICTTSPSANTTFTVNDPGTGFTIEWSTDGSTNNDGTGAGGGGSVGKTHSVNAGSSITEYARSSNNSSSCKSAWVLATGTVSSTPATPSGLTNQSSCTSSGNVSISFTVTDPGSGFNVEWSTDGTSVNDGIQVGGSGNLTKTKLVSVGSPITEYSRISNGSTSCKSAWVSATGTANASPANPVGMSNQTVCTGTGSGNVTFTITDPGSGLTVEWSTDGSTNNDGTGAGGGGNVTKVESVSAGTPITEYARLSNNSTGCKSFWVSATGTAYTNPTPTFTTAPTPVCLNSTGNVYTTQSGESNYLWTISGGSITAGGNGNSAATVTWTATGSKTITVNYIDSHGCTATSATSQSVTVNGLPTVSVIPATSTICSTDTIPLTASGAVTYSWTPGTQIDSTGGSTNRAYPSTNTTYTVTGTDANGCTGNATSAFTVKPVPVVSVTPPAAVCTGTTTVGLTASGAASYTWSPGTFLSATTGSNVTAQISLLTFYTVTGTGANGCTANSFLVPVATVPAGGNVTPVTSVICSSGTKTLTATGVAGHNYQWQISSDNITWTDISGASNTTYTTKSADGTSKKYYRIVAKSDACWDISSTTSIVDISVTPAVTITLVSSTTATVTWTPFGSGQYNVSWSGAGTGTVNGITTNNFTISSLTPNQNLSVTVTPAITCTGVTSGTASTHTLCGVPGSVSATATTAPKAFKVTWSSVSGATSYRVYYRNLVTSSSWSFVDTSGTAKTVVVPYSGATYAVYVAAKDCPSPGNIGDGTVVTFVTTNTLPACSPVPVVTANSSCPDQISITVTGGSSYAVTIRRISPGITSGSTYTINGSTVNVTVGTQYASSVWEVFARNICSPGVYSAISNVAVVTIKPSCPSLSNLMISHITCYGFDASWNTDNCSGLGVSSYQVLIKKNGALNYNSYTFSGSTDHAIIGWLSQSIKYNVEIRSTACNGATSAVSAPDTVQLPSCRTEEPAEDVSIKSSGSDKEAIAVYPNPAEGQFIVDIGRTDMTLSTVKIELMNQLGQVIQTNISEISGGHLNQLISIPASMASGIYFVRTYVGTNTYVNRLVVSKE